MSVSRLIELASARKLSRVAELLSKADAAKFVERVADPDEGLTAEPQPDATLQLALMTRRGLDRGLVYGWLPTLESSLERGLAAWDVLTGSLIDDQEWLGALRSMLEPVRDLLPSAGQRGVAFAGRSANEILQAHLGATGSSTFKLSTESVGQLGLGAVWAMYVAGDDVRHLLDEHEARAALRAHGRLLGLAHFPALASLWLQFTSSVLGDEESHAELVEILLDAHATDQLPRGVARFADTRLAKYVMARSAIDAGDPASAYALLKTVDVLTLGLALTKSEDARIQLVRAELGLRTGERPIAPARIEEIVQTAPTWRYAARVRACMAAALGARDSSSPIRMLDEYLAQFGNDDAPWLGLVEFGPNGAAWFSQMMARLTREALSLPHEPSVWIALATIVGGDEAPGAVSEIRARVAEQTRA